jgi:hypothetical protein
VAPREVSWLSRDEVCKQEDFSDSCSSPFWQKLEQIFNLIEGSWKATKISYSDILIKNIFEKFSLVNYIFTQKFLSIKNHF